MVELMVILAALGGVALIVTKLGKNSMTIQGEAHQASEYADLAREAHFLISDPDSCRASLEGKSLKIGQTPIFTNLEIWSASTGKEKGLKKFSAGKLNKLMIGSITLALSGINEETVKPGTHAVKGEFKISGIKSIQGPDRNFTDLKHSLHLTVMTNPDGVLTIKNCERYDQNLNEQARVWCGTISSNCIPFGTNVMGIGKFTNGKFTGVVHGTESNSVNCPALINQSADLEVCNEK